MARQRHIHHPPSSSILHSSPNATSQLALLSLSLSIITVCVIAHTCLPLRSHETGSDHAQLLFCPQYQAWRLTPSRGSINTVCIHVYSRGLNPSLQANKELLTRKQLLRMACSTLGFCKRNRTAMRCPEKRRALWFERTHTHCGKPRPETQGGQEVNHI